MVYNVYMTDPFWGAGMPQKATVEGITLVRSMLSVQDFKRDNPDMAYWHGEAIIAPAREARILAHKLVAIDIDELRTLSHLSTRLFGAYEVQLLQRVSMIESLLKVKSEQREAVIKWAFKLMPVTYQGGEYKCRFETVSCNTVTLSLSTFFQKMGDEQAAKASLKKLKCIVKEMRKETPSKDPIAIAYTIHQMTEQLVV